MFVLGSAPNWFGQPQNNFVCGRELAVHLEPDHDLPVSRHAVASAA